MDWFHRVIAVVERLVQEDDRSGVLRAGHVLWDLAVEEVGDFSSHVAGAATSGDTSAALLPAA